jgi:hypothetical protein
MSLKCAPERLHPSSGILYIRTSGGPLKQELSFQKKKILSKINKLDGCTEIRDLKFNS